MTAADQQLRRDDLDDGVRRALQEARTLAHALLRPQQTPGRQLVKDDVVCDALAAASPGKSVNDVTARASVALKAQGWTISATAIKQRIAAKTLPGFFTAAKK